MRLSIGDIGRAYQAYHYPGDKQLWKQRVRLKGWKKQCLISTGWIRVMQHNGRGTSTQQVATHSDTLADELLSYHHKFSHISFDRLREMARQNIIPRRLLKAPTPICTSCMYATATRRAWRGNHRRAGSKRPSHLLPASSCL